MSPVEATKVRNDLIFDIAEIRHASDSVVEIITGPSDHEPIDFLPGQYVLLEDVNHRLAPRSYSIANPPRADGSLSFLVTRVPGGQFSTWIHDELRPADQISASGPYGTFTAGSKSARPVLYLAAGSGLAPIRALIEAGLGNSPARPRTVIFSARTEDDVLDRARFAEWGSIHPELRFIRTLTRGEGPGLHGRIPTLIGDLCGDLSAHAVYIAGGPRFVTSCVAAAEASGADRARIRTEAFFVEPQRGGPNATAKVSPDDP